MKKVIITILLSVAFSVTAQEVLIGPRVGMNFSNMTNVSSSESINGFMGGLSFEYRFLDFIGLSVDALYSAEGARYDVEIADVHAGYKSKLCYLRMPVLANIYLGHNDARVRPKILLGPSLGFLVDADSEIEVAGFNTEFEMDKDDFTSVDFGAVVGAGFDFGLTDGVFLNIDGRYYFGTSKVFDVDLPAIEDVKNEGASFTMGLGFVLGQ